MYKSFLFIRHAQSLHNQMTRHLAAKNSNLSEHQLKQLSEYKEKKFSQKLMDAPISDTGEYQCKNAEKIYQKMLKQADVVITSPMERSLETTYRLFNLKEQNTDPDKKKIEVIVQPYLTEQISSACDIGANIKKNKQKYGKVMNFEKIPENSEDMWQMNYIIPQRVRQLVIDQSKSSSNTDKNIHIAILEVMKKEPIQTQDDLLARAELLKKQLREYLNRYKNKRIALVGHGYIFRILTATGFYEDGSPVNAVNLKNTQVLNIPIMLEQQKFNKSSIPLCGC